MNILHINTFDKGGAANACIRLHQGLLSAGISSKLLVAKKKEVEEITECYSFLDSLEDIDALLQEKIEIQEKNFEKIEHLPQGYEPFHFIKTPYRIDQHPLYKWADIIHFHWVADFLDWTTFFEHNEKPIVWTLHDLLPFNGGYHYEEGFPLAAYQSIIANNLKEKKNAIAKQDFFIVALSNWLLNKSNTSDLFKRFPHFLIPNGINSTKLKPYIQQSARKVLGLPPTQPLLLFVAEDIANKRKGLVYLLDALATLSAEIGLVIIGEGDKLNLNRPNVYPLGRIFSEEYMALAYSAADLFVHPAIEDNLPNTVLESILCATPVVAFDIGGIPDMITNGKNGLICSTINAKALATTIDKALATNFDTAWIRADAVARFDQSVQAKKYIDLYRSILGQPKNSQVLSTTTKLIKPIVEEEEEALLKILSKEQAFLRKKIHQQKKQIKEQLITLDSKEETIQSQFEELSKFQKSLNEKEQVIAILDKEQQNLNKVILWHKSELAKHNQIMFLIRKIANLIYGRLFESNKKE